MKKHEPTFAPLPIFGVIAAIVVTFVGSSLVALGTLDPGYPAFISSEADLGRSVIFALGFVAFIAQAVFVVRAVKRRAPAPLLRILAAPLLLILAACVLGLVLTPDASRNVARIRYAIHAPAFAIASGILSVPVAALALRTFRRATTRAFDAQTLTTFLIGMLAWLAVMSRAINWSAEDIVVMMYPSQAIALVAFTVLAASKGDDESSTNDARTIIAFAFLATLCAAIATWCLHHSHLDSPGLFTPDDKRHSMHMAQDVGWGTALLLSLSGAAIASRVRTLTPSLLLLASWIWIAVILSAYGPIAPGRDELPVIGDNDAATIALSFAVGSAIILLASFERLIAVSSSSSFVIALFPVALTALLTVLANHVGSIEHASSYEELRSTTSLHVQASQRLVAFWWTNALGVFFVVFAMAVLTLRANARAARGGRAGVRGLIAFFGGWLVFLISAAFVFATTTKTSGAWIFTLLLLGPAALAIQFLYLAGRSLDQSAEDDAAVMRDVALITVLAFVAFGFAWQAADARFTLDWPPSVPEYKDEPGITTPLSTLTATPLLVALSVLFPCAVIALTKRSRIVALRRSGLTVTLTAVVCALLLGYVASINEATVVSFKDMAYFPRSRSSR